MIGVESYKSFGDNCFNTTILKALSEKHNTKIDIASSKQHLDAFTNLPFVNTTIDIDNINSGIKYFKRNNYKQFYQITPLNFFHPSVMMSLLDVQEAISNELELNIIDYRPIIIPRSIELDNISYDVAIESEYYSNQSWAKPEDIESIVKTFNNKSILWCSKNPPLKPCIHYKPTRRATIFSLRNVEHFFCVGSGIFCASLSGYAPKHTYVLWRDDYYGYIDKFKIRGWDNNITWVHDRDQLFAILNSFRVKRAFN